MSDKIILFPNPALDFVQVLNIQNYHLGKAEIIDANGITVFSGEVTEDRLSIQHLAKGIYFLKIQTKEGLYKNKFIKN